MNLPNALTTLRVVMVPFFVVFMLTDIVAQPTGRMVAVAIFIVASLTDFFDGYLARKMNLVSNFGKFMDPLADKLLVCAALICLVETGDLAAWIVIVIISREFIISGFRLIAADNDIVIAASYWGKFKTTFQMVMIILLIFNFPGTTFYYINQFFIYASLILTIVSLIDYIVKNKDVLAGGNKS